MTESAPPAGIVLDLETTGLDAFTENILEIGMVTYDASFQPLQQWSKVITGELETGRLRAIAELAEWDDNARAVLRMHKENGLYDAVMSGGGMPLFAAVSEAAQWVRDQGANGLPLTGSTIHFDRAFLQRYAIPLNREFHYRNVDISSIVTWLRMIDPAAVDYMEEHALSAKDHRATADCLNSLEKLRLLSGYYDG